MPCHLQTVSFLLFTQKTTLPSSLCPIISKLIFLIVSEARSIHRYCFHSNMNKQHSTKKSFILQLIVIRCAQCAPNHAAHLYVGPISGRNHSGQLDLDGPHLSTTFGGHQITLTPSSQAHKFNFFQKPIYLWCPIHGWGGPQLDGFQTTRCWCNSGDSHDLRSWMDESGPHQHKNQVGVHGVQCAMDHPSSNSYHLNINRQNILFSNSYMEYA